MRLIENQQWSWWMILGAATVAPIIYFLAVRLGGNEAAFVPVIIIAGAIAGYVFWQALLCKSWALLSIAVFAVGILGISFQSREIGDAGLNAQTGLKMIIWLAMLAISLFNVRRLALYLNDTVTVAFGCYCLIAVLSATYSRVPSVSGITALGTLSYLTFACLLAVEIPKRRLIMVLVWTFMVLSILNAIAAVVVPDVAFLQGDPSDLLHKHAPTVRLQGVLGGPNLLGRVESVYVLVVFAAAYYGYMRAAFWIPNILLGLGEMWMSQSRGALIGVVLGIGLQTPRRYLLILGALAVLGGVGIFVTGQSDSALALLGRDGTADETKDMAGRADLWAFVWALIMQSPVIGYGFNSFESYAGTLWTGERAAGVAAHNSYLSVLYSTGFFGGVPFAIGFVILLWRWLTRPDPARDAFVIAALFCGYVELDVLQQISVVPSLNFCMIIAWDACARHLRAGVRQEPWADWRTSEWRGDENEAD